MSRNQSQSIGSAVHHFNPYCTEDWLTMNGLIQIYIATTLTVTLTLRTNHRSVNVSLADGNRCCQGGLQYYWDVKCQ